MPQPTQTITIDNFSAKLTREIHGDINSGFCPLQLSFGGVFPISNISYSSQLGFVEAATNIDASSKALSDTIVRAINLSDTTAPANNLEPYVYALGNEGNVYNVRVSDIVTPTPDNDLVTSFTNQTAITAHYGGGLIFAGSTLYVGHDNGIVSWSSLSPTTATATALSAVMTGSRPRPLVQFNQYFYAGNDNNISEFTTAGTQNDAVAGARLSPGFPNGYVVRDLAVSNDGRYLVMVGARINSLTTLSVSALTSTAICNQQIYNNIDSVIGLWNGSDTGLTTIIFFRGVNISSVIVSNTETLLFGKDNEGVGLWDLNGDKLGILDDLTATLSHSYPPSPGSAFAVGKKIYFQAQYGSTIYLFCIDRQDNSLYCLYSTSMVGTVEYVKGAVIVPSIHHVVKNSASGTDLSRSKVYFAISKAPTSTQANNSLYSLHLQNYAGNKFTGGVYSTQIMKMPIKIQPTEIRVFCQPTSANISFSVALTSSGVVNNAVLSNTSNTYTFAAGTDKTKAQGALDMIRFPIQAEPMQSIGVQISNLSTTSPYINKIEIDYVPLGVPKTS